MKPLAIQEIARAVQGKTKGEGLISSIVIDSRKVTEGCLFICIEGGRYDGHAFAQKAGELGAAAVLCHKDVPGCAPVIRVKDTREALLTLAEYYRGLFSIPVVGLTGSVGKTTTKEMTALVVSSGFSTLKTEGNHNNEIGLPLTLFGLTDNTGAAVIEMGMSDFGEISRLTKTARPTIGVITNIGVSHMENLGSREGILQAKMEIIEGMPQGAPLILNGDDPYLNTIKREDFRIIRFAVKNEAADVRAEDIVTSENNTEFTACFGSHRQRVTLPTVGIHNVYNALAALTVGLCLHIDPEKCAGALAGYTPAGMRQRQVEKNGVLCIEDCYNASPDSMRAALNTLSCVPGKKKVAVLADMLELGAISKAAHFEVGAMAAEQGVSLLLAYGELGENYVAGAKSAGLKNAYHFEEKAALEEQLFAALEAGDAVLFKASRGMKMEEVIENLYERWKNQ